jgi:hypothetical protein
MALEIVVCVLEYADDREMADRYGHAHLLAFHAITLLTAFCMHEVMTTCAMLREL